MSRRLKIDLSDLELAFENSGFELMYYLDLESGEVLLVTDEMRSAFEEISEVAETDGIEFAEALAHSDLPAWEKEAMAQVAAVKERYGTTVIDVPQDESSDAFHDMQEFAESVRDPGTQDRLLRALSGGRPFRRFKDAIAAYPQEQERWYAFRDGRVRQRVLDWLEAEEIELID